MLPSELWTLAFPLLYISPVASCCQLSFNGWRHKGEIRGLSGNGYGPYGCIISVEMPEILGSKKVWDFLSIRFQHFWFLALRAFRQPSTPTKWRSPSRLESSSNPQKRNEKISRDEGFSGALVWLILLSWPNEWCYPLGCAIGISTTLLHKNVETWGPHPRTVGCCGRFFVIQSCAQNCFRLLHYLTIPWFSSEIKYIFWLGIVVPTSVVLTSSNWTRWKSWMMIDVKTRKSAKPSLGQWDG